MILNRLPVDLHRGFRSLLRHRAYSLTVLITLTLAIGANSAIFTLANALILAALPVRHPERLVEICTIDARGEKGNLSIPAFQSIQRRASALASAFAWSGGGMENLEMNGVPFAGSVDDVAGDYYATLNIHPALGRLLTREDIGLDHFTPAAVAVISYRAWQTRYGGGNVLGKALRINGRPFTIIGVHPASFHGIIREVDADATVPASATAIDAAHFYDPDHRYFTLIGRLQDGTDIGKARAQLEAIWRTGSEAIAPVTQPARSAFLARRIQMEPAARGISYLRTRFTRPLLILFGIAGLLVLLACVNLANVALARAETRAIEFSIRAALGARPRRLIKEALLESCLLGGCGVVPGLLLAYWGSSYIGQFMWQGFVPLAIALRPDARVVLFTAAVALGASLLFALVPAWRSARQDPGATLAHAGSRIAGGTGLLGPALATVQIALSFAILACALLFSRSLGNTLRADPGFTANHLLIAQLFPRSTYRGLNQAAYLRQLMDALRSLPGVTAATISHDRPIGMEWKQTILPANVSATSHLVAPAFFETLRMRLLQGRDFTLEDDERHPRVAILSEQLARLVCLGRNLGHSPIGQRMKTIGGKEEFAVIGVVADAALDNPRLRNPAAIYFPLFQEPDYLGWAAAIVRTANDPAGLSKAVRKTIESFGYEYPLRMETVQEEYEHALLPERVLALLTGFIGGLGLLLAAVGLYGLLAYTVSRRTGELAVRVALGAAPADVAGLILRQVAAILAIGLSLGLAIFWAGTRAITALLYGLSGHDPQTLLEAAGVLIAVALLASLAPGLRASRTDPAAVLRHQ